MEAELEKPTDPMRSTLRSLTFGLAAACAGATMAQQPYTIIVSGVVAGCYPGQVVNVETNSDTQPYWNLDVPVDPGTCTWSVALNVASNPASFTASTPCNGMIVSAIGVAQFNFIMDSAFVSMTLDCGGGDLYDCNNVLNGPDMPGTPCDDGDPMTFGDLWTPACVCIGQDSSQTVDCLGEVGGSALPGTACTDFFGNAGIWTADCFCQTNSNPEDCEGNPGGGALPGTVCVYTPDSGNTWITGIWSVDCVCEGDTTGGAYDCLGELNGPALPGTPCQAFGMVGTWNSACECVPEITPCEANFWVIQAMGPDSLPVPYELWVWNLSTGGSGNFAFTWDFGDGTSSMDAYPTHTYTGNGPYNLCLTIMDNNGCMDTYCDSVSINGDGIYEGMVVHGEVRQDGFTINVQDPQAMAVQEASTTGNIATWPNPAVDELNVAVVSGMKGLVTVTITDLDGRTMKTERMSLSGGRSQLRIATSALNAGMYMLRISDGATNLSQRFVKTN